MNRRLGIRIGLIGCGTIAYWQHLRNAKRLHGVTIAGLADPCAEALARAARLTGAPGFPNAEDLMSMARLDAVIIVSPAGLHAEHVAKACTAGLHVFVEKPLAHDVVSLAAVRSCARGTRKVLAVGYNLRFHPACRRLRSLLQCRAVGEVRAAISQFTEWFDLAGVPEWRRARRLGGGVLLDLATHHVDLYRWLLQDELAEVTVDARTRRIEQDSASVRGTTRRGIDVHGYFAQDGSRAHRIAVHGTSGVLQLDLHSGTLLLQRNRRLGYGVRTRAARLDVDCLLWRGRKCFQPSYDPSHRDALRAFVVAVADPRRRHPDLATFDDGAAALEGLFEAERQALAGTA